MSLARTHAAMSNSSWCAAAWAAASWVLPTPPNPVIVWVITPARRWLSAASSWASRPSRPVKWATTRAAGGWRRSANVTAGPCVSALKIVRASGKDQVSGQLDGLTRSLSGKPGP